jgi:uncharacterized protein YlxW (UPF0749 family)
MLYYIELFKKAITALLPYVYQHWKVILVVSVVSVFMYNYYSMKAELIELKLKDEITQLQQTLNDLKKESEKLKEKVIQLDKLKKYNKEDNKRVNKELRKKNPDELKKEASNYVKRLKLKRGT